MEGHRGRGARLVPRCPAHVHQAYALRSARGQDENRRRARRDDQVGCPPGRLLVHGRPTRPEHSVVDRALAAVKAAAVLVGDPAFDQALIKAIYAERGRKNDAGVLVYVRATLWRSKKASPSGSKTRSGAPSPCCPPRDLPAFADR